MTGPDPAKAATGFVWGSPVMSPTGQVARRDAFAVWVLAFAVRCLVLAASWQGQGEWNRAPDSSRYLSLADSWTTDARFSLPDSAGTHRPEYLTLPPYPLLLAALKSLGAKSVLPVLVVQCVLGALVAAMVFALVSRMGGQPAGLVAGVLASLDVQSVAYGNMVLTDALSMAAVFCVVAAMFRYLERKSTASALLSGVAVAAAVFVRPVNVVMIGMGAVAVIAANLRHDRRRILVHLPAILLVGLLPVLAWSMRNYALSGMWFYSTSGDVVLVRWQLPRLLSEIEQVPLEVSRQAVASRLQIDEVYATLGVRPPTYRAKVRALARELVAAHPGTFLRLYLEGLARVSGQPDEFICQLLGWPVVEGGLSAGKIGVGGAFRRRWEELPWGLRLLYFGQLPYLAGLWVLGALGAWAGLRAPGRRAPVVILLLSVTLFVVLAGGYPGSPRYRLPGMPLLIMLASLGAGRVLRRRNPLVVRE